MLQIPQQTKKGGAEAWSYTTPKFSGWQVMLQYSAGANAYEDDPDDGVRAAFGVRHGVSFGNLYAGAQYFKEARHFLQEANQSYGRSDVAESTLFLTNEKYEKFGKDGYGINLGIDYFALGGTIKGQIDDASCIAASLGIVHNF